MVDCNIKLKHRLQILSTVVWLIMSCATTVFAQNKTLDSLHIVLKNAKYDTTMCDAYYQIGEHYFITTELYDTAIFYLNKSLFIANKVQDEKRKGVTNWRLGQAHNLNLSNENKNKELHHFLLALNYYETTNKNQRACEIYKKIARIYFDNKSYLLGKKYLFKLLTGATKLNNKELIRDANTQLALSNIGLNYIDSAIYYQTNNFDQNKKDNNKNELLFDYCNLSKCYLLNKNYSKCELFCNQGLVLAKEIKDSTFTDVELYTYLGGVYNARVNYTAAIAILNKVVSTNIDYGDHPECIEAFKELSHSYSKINKYDSAYYYNVKYHAILANLFNAEETEKLNQLNATYEIDNRETKIALLNKHNEINDAKLKQQRILFYAIGIVLLLMIALALFIYKNLKAKQAANLLLQLKNDEINKAHNLLARKNELIHDSIVYAQHIQELLMPGDADLKEFSHEYFIFYQPKDFVSGDIYWINKIDHNNIIISAVDCTGHGVPGAMMSILAYDLLEYAVNEQKITEPADILNCIKQRIKEKLKLAIAKEFHEGMDLSLCKLNTATNILTYSGARNSIIIVRNNEVIELTVDRQSMNVNTVNDFTQNTFAVQTNDMVYLFSDGFADQKGGPNNKKVYYSKFKTILQHTATMPCQAQHSHVSVFINEWMYNQTLQIDDMMVVGFRIK
jgi:serine phosphatase RsbU (regulator of sigma subunit)